MYVIYVKKSNIGVENVDMGNVKRQVDTFILSFRRDFSALKSDKNESFAEFLLSCLALY